MKFVSVNQSYSLRWFSRRAYLIIALACLQLVAAILIYLFSNQRPPPWIELLWNFCFAGGLAYTLWYFYKKFKLQIDEHIKEHIKLFKKNPYPMWVYDLTTLKFLAVNDAAVSLYGYTREELLSSDITAIRPEEDVPALISTTDKIKFDFNHQYHWSGMWRHKKKSGEMIYVEISSHEIIYEGKKSELVLAYNVTDRVLQDQKLQAMNQDLERKVIMRTNDLLTLNTRLVDQYKIIKSANLELFTMSTELQEANYKIQEHADLKNRFVSMASHEFRTPLANIAFSAGFIRHHINKMEPKNIIAKLESIEKHVSHMASLLDDVLTIGKADSVKLEANKTLLDLPEFIAHVSQEVQTASNNTHQVQVTMNENVPARLHTDEKFLRNIFINLLSNGIKYSPDQQAVYVNIYSADRQIYFEFTDHGMGIGREDLGKIFEPFYRTNGTQNIKGTGLGLSIVKRAADLLEARIVVQSELGKGSTFTVALPVDEA